MPEAERQWELGIEKRGVGWQGCGESKSLFPRGKVICKGIVPKSVTKGKMESEGRRGGGEECNGKGVEIEKEKKKVDGSAVVDVLVINKKVQMS